jgi:uncharacterized repeat protein (TIGR01451 family)
VAVEAAGTILVTDQDAGTGAGGALFQVDPTTGIRTILSDFGNSTQGPVGVTTDGVAVPLAAAVADMRLTKSTNKPQVKSGSNLNYTMTVTNAGPNMASAVVMTDPLPNGTGFISATPSQGTCTTPQKNASGTVSCTLGSLASGASATVTIVVKVNVPGGSTLRNTASVSANTTDPNPNNNAATITTPVTK